MMITRTAAPRMIHNQMRLKLKPLDDAGELLAGVVGAAVVGAAGVLAVLGVGDGGGGDDGAVAVTGALGEGLVVAPLALCTHAAARHPVTRMTDASSALLTTRRLPVLARVRFWRNSRPSATPPGPDTRPGGRHPAARVRWPLVA